MDSAIILYQQDLGEVESTDAFYWRYAYAGRSRRSGDTKYWVVSNPCQESNPYVIAPGDTVTVTGDDYTVTDDCDVTHLVFYRRQGGNTDGEYIGMAILPTVALSDTGGTGDYDDGLYLSQYLELDHDTGSSAKYLLFADQRVYAACLSYDAVTAQDWLRKTAIQISTRKKPWYFPTTVDENSDPDSGTELDDYAVTGSEFRGWGRGVD